MCDYRCLYKEDEVRIVAFAETSHSLDWSQLCFLIATVYCTVTEWSVRYRLDWESQESRKSVISTPTADILDASAMLDELMPSRFAIEYFFEPK